jgi:hypothetical protein
MAQFGINQAANLDNPLPGVRDTRPPSEPKPRRKTEEKPPQLEMNDKKPESSNTGSGERRRIDFYA